MTLSDEGPPAVWPRALPDTDTASINLRWMIRLRWVAIAGQVLLIAAVEVAIGIELPLVPLFALIGLEAASNVACSRWAAGGARVPPWLLAGLIAADIAGLTALLYLSGGPVNPFTLLYLVQVALAAVILRRLASWAVVALATAAYGALFLLPGSGLDDHMMLHGPDHMRLHLVGMWVAFTVAGVFIVYFVQEIRGALARREAELADARARTARHEQFAALAALAAGAAHELATPLSTIAVVARELDRQLTRDGADPVTLGDIRLVRAQVDRCRDILARMAADAGEAPRAVSIRELIAEAVEGLPAAPRCLVSVPAEQEGAALCVPVRAVAQALRAVLQNAVQVSAPGAPVRLEVNRRDGMFAFAVRDRGPGMAPHVLRHAGEPFFTTKPPGHGMGLGLYLARATLTQIGGRLDIDSAEGAGTTVTLLVPPSVHACAGRETGQPRRETCG